MHASALYVTAGQTVSAGQQIAAVGNTGNSFGAHLHFQVEINGSALDPLLFL
jgi:murein DD-endopeptidase MepM/ murein hydrolase activator NlpD